MSRPRLTRHNEAHLSAEQPQAVPQARVPPSHVDPRRAGDLESAPSPWPGPAERLSPVSTSPHSPRARPARIVHKHTFDDLRTSRRRGRSGPVAVHYLAAASADGLLYVAYAVPRRVGTAVERNRCRRRLRAIVVEAAETVPAGAYLIRVSPPVRGVSFEELRRRVIEAMKGASEGKPR